MSDLEQQLGDRIADGKLTNEDAEAMLIFRDFLQDTPAGMAKIGGESPEALFADRDMTYAERQVKWLPYACGMAEGPSTPEEWPGYREQIRAEQRR
jgi:hypothetical protein